MTRPPAPRPVAFSSASSSTGDREGIELPALPDLGDATIEDVLLAVQEHLKLLYRLVDPTNAPNPRYDSGASR